MLLNVQQHASINVRGFLEIKTNNLARIVNAHLCFVMATVPYLLYITTTFYLNTTYTLSSTKNGLKNKQQVNIINATNGLAIINVDTDNIIMPGDDTFAHNIYWQR